ncbi:MAG TPA: Hcp family type VI secretion system effector [bacterium]|nr:Hcp family type VI secretion system effector [bacterium]
MAMPSHLSLTGKTQGKIEGSCDIAGREGTVLVYSMEHLINIPRDTHTGLPTGKRIHGSLKIVKEIDKASPKLFQALCSGEQFSEVLLDYYRISPAGAEEKYYTIKLQNAIIVDVRAWFPETLVKSNEPFKHMEDISFSYEKIIWTWVPDGIEAEDSWSAPK